MGAGSPQVAVESAFAVRAPAPPLRPYVAEYVGYAERPAGELRRRQVPISRAVLIMGWAEPLTVTDPRVPPATATPVTSFATGLFDSYVVTSTRGLGRGVELLLTPLGARRLLGLPLGELTNRVVGLDELPGRWLRDLAARLAEAPGWAVRFDLLDRVLGARLAASPAPAARLAEAWRVLDRSAGRVSVASLADRLGWSRRHLSATLHREIGLPPKTLARVLRFERAFGVLGADAGSAASDAGRPAVLDHAGPTGWAAVAAACGYADQAHLIREFQAFAGATPVDLAARRLAAGGIGD
jgi:AraC-like DNA-binding protein